MIALHLDDVSIRDRVLDIWVDGVPETKGSWRALPSGRMKRDNPREAGWANAIGWAAKAKWLGRAPLTCSLLVEARFFLPRPIGKKNRRDIDKLLRSAFDAMQKIVYIDDEQIADVVTSRRVRPSMTGAQIRIYTTEPLTYG